MATLTPEGHTFFVFINVPPRPSEANDIVGGGGGGGWQQWKPRGIWGHAPPDNFKI